MQKTVEIVEYDPAWPEDFARIGAQIRAALGERALRIHHIGSTSVPGLAAKNILDIQLSVAGLDRLDDVAGDLAGLGLEHYPQHSRDAIPQGLAPDDPLNNPIEWTKSYFKRRGSERHINLHMRVLGRANQRLALLFRDFLRSNSRAAATYVLLKKRIARYHPYSIEAYVDIKDPSIALIILAAEMWAEETGWALPETDV